MCRRLCRSMTGRYQNGFHSGDALLFGVDENMGQMLDVDCSPVDC